MSAAAKNLLLSIAGELELEAATLDRAGEAAAATTRREAAAELIVWLVGRRRRR